MGSKVFLIAGGSGGHLFPAISLTDTDKTFDYYNCFLDPHVHQKLLERKNLNISKYFLLH